MKILPKQFSYNSLPLFAAVRTAEMRNPPSRAARTLSRRWGLSPSVSEIYARANGLGPREER
jgi:hypothetical protein